MGNHFKIHELLSASELEALHAYAREPGRTVDECHEWLQAQGFTLARSSVGRWKAEFDGECLAERMSGAGKLAAVFMDAARTDGGLQIPDAAVLQVSQMIFEQGARLAGGDDVDADSLAKMALALQRLMLAKGRLELTRSEIARQQKAAVEAAESVAKQGGSAVDVVSKVREILGIGGGAGRAA